jgi:hypothetical protein
MVGEREGERENEVTRLWRLPQDVFIFFGRGSSFFGTAIRLLLYRNRCRVRSPSKHTFYPCLPFASLPL